MASSIGDVFDIEFPDSYIKRPAGPMVTVEVKDISKLAEIIRIPSMAEGAGLGDTTAQRILYSRLSNQCKKCRKFGHLAKNCPLIRSPTQDGNIPPKAPPERRGKNEQGRNTSTQRWSTEKTKGATNQQGKGGIRANKDHPSKGEGTGRNPHNSGNLQHTARETHATGEEEEKKKKLAPPPPSSHPHTRIGSKNGRLHRLTATQANERSARHHHPPGSRIHSKNQIVLCNLGASKLPGNREHGKP